MNAQQAAQVVYTVDYISDADGPSEIAGCLATDVPSYREAYRLVLAECSEIEHFVTDRSTGTAPLRFRRFVTDAGNVYTIRCSDAAIASARF